MLRLIFEIHHAIWDHRNAMVHNDPEKEQAKRNQLEAAVRAEHSRGNEDLLPSNLHLMNPACHVILERSLPEQELWLRQIRAARRQGSANSRIHMAQERALMAAWLQLANHTAVFRL